MVPVDEIAPLRQLIRERSSWLIAVDGMNGVGKTTRVAARLGRRVVSLDDFLPGDGRFLSGIRLEDLREAVTGQSTPVVVEGCCVLEVLTRAGLRPDLHVYVRRLNKSGRWGDDQIGMGEDMEHQLQVLREIDEAVRVMEGDDAYEPIELHEDLVRYHAQHLPCQNADLVVDLREDA